VQNKGGGGERGMQKMRGAAKQNMEYVLKKGFCIEKQSNREKAIIRGKTESSLKNFESRISKPSLSASEKSLTVLQISRAAVSSTVMDWKLKMSPVIRINNFHYDY